VRRRAEVGKAREAIVDQQELWNSSSFWQGNQVRGVGTVPLISYCLIA